MVEICPLYKNHMQESHGQFIFTCLQKAGASHRQDQLPNQLTLAWHCCSHQIQACQKQWHIWVTPPSQLLQLHKIISSLLPSWLGFAFASSRYSAPPASLRHHSAPAQPLLIQSWCYFFTDKLEDDDNIAQKAVHEVFSGFLPHRHFLGSNWLCITSNSAFTDWDYLRSRIILSHSAVNSANPSDTFQVEIRAEHLHTIT